MSWLELTTFQIAGRTSDRGIQLIDRGIQLIDWPSRYELFDLDADEWELKNLYVPP
jgi:hypothetical protein